MLKKYYKKVLLGIGGVFLLIQFFFVVVDVYNFLQLKKAIPALELSKGDAYFYDMKTFNETYDIDLYPIRGCYYISNKTKDDTYIFGFKLNSLFFKLYHGKTYYAYPYYNKEYWKFCDGTCYDKARDIFIRTISNPCKD